MTTKAAATLRASRPGVINLWQRGVPVYNVAQFVVNAELGRPYALIEI